MIISPVVFLYRAFEIFAAIGLSEPCVVTNSALVNEQIDRMEVGQAGLVDDHY